METREGEKTTYAVLYAAKSTKDVNDSIERQLNDIRAKAERNGWVVDSTWSDEDESAYSGSRGDELVSARERCAAIASEGGDAVLFCFKTNRLARGDVVNATHLVEYGVEALKKGYRIKSATQPIPDGKASLTYLSMCGDSDNESSVSTADAVASGKRQAAESGRRTGGRRPTGYEIERVKFDEEKKRWITRLVQIPSEVEMLRRIGRELIAGRSQGDIADGLNHDGYRTPPSKTHPNGNRWGQNQILQLMKNRLYLGETSYKPKGAPESERVWYVPPKGTIWHEPVWSGEEWDEIHALRATRETTGHQGGRKPVGDRFLLGGGLLRCSCGSTMQVRTQRDKNGQVKHEWYRCEGRHSRRSPDCKTPHIPRVDIDTPVFEKFSRVALDIEAMRREAEELRDLRLRSTVEQVRNAETGAMKAQERFSRMHEYLRDGRITPEEWRTQEAELGPELRVANAKVENLKAHEKELRNRSDERDAEADALRDVAAIREALSESFSGEASDVPGASEALRRVFAGFVFHYREPVVIAGQKFSWWIEPCIRNDAVIVASDEHSSVAYERGSTGKLKKVPIRTVGASGIQPTASGR